jgi:hypothetical protein
MLNTVSEYIRDAKKTGGQARGQTSALPLSTKVNVSLQSWGRNALGRGAILLHHEDVALISSVSHIQSIFLEIITRVALEDRYQAT